MESFVVRLAFDPPEGLQTRIEVFDGRAAPVFRTGPGSSDSQPARAGAKDPSWMHEDDSLLWSDIPNDRMLRWSQADGMSVWRERVEFTNGHTRDRDGSLLHCSHGLRACTAPMARARRRSWSIASRASVSIPRTTSS